MGGIFMGKHYGEQAIEGVLKMRGEGLTYKEIGVTYGKSSEQIRDLIRRHRKKEAKLAAGIEVLPKGRPRTRNLTKEQEIGLQIKRLEREVTLLRSFLRVAGRM